MKIPLCKICLKTGTYCQKCESTIAEGLVSPLDIKVLKILLDSKLVESIDKGVEYVKSINIGKRIVVLIRGNLNIEQTERMKNLLSRRLRSRVQIVVGSDDPEQLVRELYKPVRVLAVGRVHLPGDMKALRVTITSKDYRRWRRKIEDMTELASRLTGYYIYVSQI